MGANLARNIARHGYSIAVHNRPPAKMHDFVGEFGHEGEITGTETIEEFGIFRQRSSFAFNGSRASAGGTVGRYHFARAASICTSAIAVLVAVSSAAGHIARAGTGIRRAILTGARLLQRY